MSDLLERGVRQFVDPDAQSLQELTRHHAGEAGDDYAPLAPPWAGRACGWRPAQRRDEEQAERDPDRQIAQRVPDRVRKPVGTCQAPRLIGTAIAATAVRTPSVGRLRTPLR